MMNTYAFFTEIRNYERNIVELDVSEKRNSSKNNMK
jgi:hypothetical protein